jgi:BirA family biotin operon repressor/biotin-[acetyl-CoA-carboxylase] ligase
MDQERDALSAGAIAEHLRRLGRDAARPLVVRDVTGSTNDDALAAAAAGAPHGSVFVADAQTSGRGRSGHTWHSPPGENVYLSMVARPRVPAASVPSITPAVGVAVARAAADRLAGRARVWVKWPNDVLAGPRDDARKLAGVLVEALLRDAEVTSLVIGVGVNVQSTTFPPELAGRATSLAGLGAADLARSSIAAEIVAALDAAVARFEDGGFPGFRDDAARLDWLGGRRVSVGGTRGVASGIDGEGRLLVERDDGEVVAAATGEVVMA